MNKIVILAVIIGLLNNCQSLEHRDLFVAGVAQPEILLNGTWKISTAPPSKFWELTQLNEDWDNIQVPGECMMQGFSIQHDVPFVYQKLVEIPLDYDKKRILLQFEGVYSYARVWINGQYLRDHSGGFTKWTCDISSYVKPGNKVLLTVEVTDKRDDISYASGYAKHPIGGILRSVTLMAMPLNYPEDVFIKTDFDENYQHATLNISGYTKTVAENATITFELLDPNAAVVPLERQFLSLVGGRTFEINNLIKHPLKWDAEHPHLYQLLISYSEKGKLIWQKKYKIGFREIEVSRNQLLVNGKPAKLRGANRHDIHPLLGRVSTAEYELQDVLLAKEANMNFIRTSHYPPSENFLALCDEYGLYVEDETAVCFVDTWRTKEYGRGNTQSDTSYTQAYLSQLKEMVTPHKNHPSVIMWSIGNENVFGDNFKQSYHWVKQYDETRPVIFSYPGHVPDSVKAYDILSMHYPDISGNLEQNGITTKGFNYETLPVIFDEWAHVACYNNQNVAEDPNIRDFWGISLDSMWQKTFDAPGGLGGAIWCMIDETFMLPDTLPGFNEWWGIIDERVSPAAYAGSTVGYGEWGIVDTWRRKKPEFWNTKKAYSPVKVLQTEMEWGGNEKQLIVPLYNRFDHTNIGELNIQMHYKDMQTNLTAPSIEPHAKGELKIDIEEWDGDEDIELSFWSSDNRLIDQYTLRQKKRSIPEKNMIPDGPIRVIEEEGSLAVILENGIRVIFDKTNGLIREVEQTTGHFKIAGPLLNLRTKGEEIMYSYHKINNYGENWRLDNMNYELADNTVKIHISGRYDKIADVSFLITVLADGQLSIDYTIKKVPREWIREIGIQFTFEDIFDTISWNRTPYWSYYPMGHLSAANGSAPLYQDQLKTYRGRPTQDWHFDSKSFYYEGTDNEVSRAQLTRIARSTKENVLNYSLMKDRQSLFSVSGEERVSCRLAKVNGGLRLFANNASDYVDLAWGNYQRDIRLTGSYSNSISFQINKLEKE